MEYLLPSEIARLVYGYLESEKCFEAANVFLKTSDQLKECYQVSLKSRKFSTKVMGYSLLKCLDQFCAVHRLVQDRIAAVQANNICSYELVDQVAYLLDVGCKGHSTVMFNITVPVQEDMNRTIDESATGASKNVASTPGSESNDSVSYSVSMEGSPSKPTWCITNTTPPHSNQSLPLSSPIINEAALPIAEAMNVDSLSVTMKSQKKTKIGRKDPLPVSKVIEKAIQDEKLHVKIADNINKVMSTPDKFAKEKEKESNGGDELESVIKTIVNQTQKDPYFENFLDEFFDGDGVVKSGNVDNKNTEEESNSKKKDCDNNKKLTRNSQKKTKSKKSKGETCNTRDDIAVTNRFKSSYIEEPSCSEPDHNVEGCCGEFAVEQISQSSSRTVSSLLQPNQHNSDEAKRQISTGNTVVLKDAEMASNYGNYKRLSGISDTKAALPPSMIPSTIKQSGSSSSIIVLPPACGPPQAPVPIQPNILYSPIVSAPTNVLALPCLDESEHPRRVIIAENNQNLPRNCIYTKDVKPGIVLSSGFSTARPFINIAPKRIAENPAKAISKSEASKKGSKRCFKEKNNPKSDSPDDDAQMGEVLNKRRNTRSTASSSRKHKPITNCSVTESSQTLMKSAMLNSSLRPVAESVDCQSEIVSTDDPPNAPTSSLFSASQTEVHPERVSINGSTPQLDGDHCVENMPNSNSQIEKSVGNLSRHGSLEAFENDDRLPAVGCGCEQNTSKSSSQVEKSLVPNSSQITVLPDTCVSNSQPNNKCSSPKFLSKTNNVPSSITTNTDISHNIYSTSDHESHNLNFTLTNHIDSVSEIVIQSSKNSTAEENTNKPSEVVSTDNVESVEKEHKSSNNSLVSVPMCENVDKILNRLVIKSSKNSIADEHINKSSEVVNTDNNLSVETAAKQPNLSNNSLVSVPVCENVDSVSNKLVMKSYKNSVADENTNKPPEVVNTDNTLSIESSEKKHKSSNNSLVSVPMCEIVDNVLNKFVIKSSKNSIVDENINKSSEVVNTDNNLSVETAAKQPNLTNNSLVSVSMCENVNSVSNKLVMKSSKNSIADENIKKSSEIVNIDNALSVESVAKQLNSTNNSLVSVSMPESVDRVSKSVVRNMSENASTMAMSSKKNLSEEGITTRASIECANSNSETGGKEAAICEDSLPNIVFLDPCSLQEVSASISVVSASKKETCDESKLFEANLSTGFSSKSESKINSDFKKLISPANQNRTQKLSLSTPRNKRNHVRVLDFSTPPTQRDKPLRAAFTSPKLFFAGDNVVEDRFRNVCRSHLFESPSMKNTLCEVAAKQPVGKVSNIEKLGANALQSERKISQSVEFGMEVARKSPQINLKSQSNHDRNLHPSYGKRTHHIFSNDVTNAESGILNLGTVCGDSMAPSVSNMIHLQDDDDRILLEENSNNFQRSKAKKCKNKCVNSRNVTTVSVTKSNYTKIIKKVTRKTVKSQKTCSPSKRKLQKSKAKTPSRPVINLSLKNYTDKSLPIESNEKHFGMLANSRDETSTNVGSKGKLELKFKNGNVLTISKISKGCAGQNSSTADTSERSIINPSTRTSKDCDSSKKRTTGRSDGKVQSGEHWKSPENAKEKHRLKSTDANYRGMNDSMKNSLKKNTHWSDFSHHLQRDSSQSEMCDDKVSILEAVLRMPTKLSCEYSQPFNLGADSNKTCSSKKSTINGSKLIEQGSNRANLRETAKKPRKEFETSKSSDKIEELKDMCSGSDISIMPDASNCKLEETSTIVLCKNHIIDEYAHAITNREESHSDKMVERSAHTFAHQDSLLTDTAVRNELSNFKPLMSEQAKAHCAAQSDSSISDEKNSSFLLKEHDGNTISLSESCSSENNLLIVTMEEEKENMSINDLSKVEKPRPAERNCNEIEKLTLPNDSAVSEHEVCLKNDENIVKFGVEKLMEEQLLQLEHKELKTQNSEHDKLGSLEIKTSRGNSNQAFVCMVHDEIDKLPYKFGPHDFQSNESFLQNFVCELEIEQENNVVNLCRIAVSEEKTLLSIPSKSEQHSATFDPSKVKKKVYHHHKTDKTKLPLSKEISLKNCNDSSKNSPFLVVVSGNVDLSLTKDRREKSTHKTNLVGTKIVRPLGTSENEPGLSLPENWQQVFSEREKNANRCRNSRSKTKVDTSENLSFFKSSNLKFNQLAQNLRSYSSEEASEILNSKGRSFEAKSEMDECLPRRDNFWRSRKLESQSVVKKQKVAHCHRHSREKNSENSRERNRGDDIDYGVFHSRGNKLEPEHCNQSDERSKTHSKEDLKKWAVRLKNSVSTSTSAQEKARKRPHRSESSGIEDRAVSDLKTSHTLEDKNLEVTTEVSGKKYKQDLEKIFLSAES